MDEQERSAIKYAQSWFMSITDQMLKAKPDQQDQILSNAFSAMRKDPQAPEVLQAYAEEVIQTLSLWSKCKNAVKSAWSTIEAAMRQAWDWLCEKCSKFCNWVSDKARKVFDLLAAGVQALIAICSPKPNTAVFPAKSAALLRI